MRHASTMRGRGRRHRHAPERASALSRHLLVVLGLLLGLAVVAWPTHARSQDRLPDTQRIEVVRGAGQGGPLPVSVGIPLPPGRLRDAAMLRIVDAHGTEVAAAVTPMLTWHFRDGSLRAVRAQFRAAPGRYYFLFDARRAASTSGWPYAEGLIDGHLAATATLTPEWLTASLIAGPQAVAESGEPYAGYVDAQFKWARELPVKDSTAWLFDRPSTLFKAYVRTGRADYLAAAEESYRWYMKGIRREGIAASPVCAGGWLPDGKPCDVKYVYIEPILLAMALTGDDGMHDRELVGKMATLWNDGGWNGPPGPYRHADNYFTERLAGLGLLETVAAYELTGEATYRERIDARVGWLQAHQADNPDGLGDDGSWRNSWNVHENDRGGKNDVRGASPWMSENIVDGLWHAWLVTADKRIPDMILGFGLYLERYGWIDPKLLVSPHDWRNGCSGPDGQIAWYWSSSKADTKALMAIQESEGWYSDGHTVELGLPVAAAYYFAHDAGQAATFKKRFEAIGHSYAPACGAIADTLRRFNWNNRGAGVAQWMIRQKPGAGRTP